MDSIILEQLKKVENVNIPYVDDEARKIIIPKYVQSEHELTVDHMYIISVNQSDSINTNWNKGFIPPKTMICKVENKIGDLAYVLGSAVEQDNYYEPYKIWGPSFNCWVSCKTTKIISEVKM